MKPPNLTSVILKPNPLSPVEYIKQVREKVHQGDSRQDVLVKLDDAWAHSSCKGDGDLITTDLFFYGPKKRKSATIIIVTYRVEKSKKIVDFVGGEENYRIHLYEGKCYPEIYEILNE